jgi:hypothetical protein
MQKGKAYTLNESSSSTLCAYDLLSGLSKSGSYQTEDLACSLLFPTIVLLQYHNQIFIVSLSENKKKEENSFFSTIVN